MIEFVLTNNVLKEYNKIEKKNKKLKDLDSSSNMLIYL